MEATRGVGFATAKALISRARTPVTDGTIIGLVLGLWAWAFISRDGAQFGSYIGVATAFGLFGGLGLLAVDVVREFTHPEVRMASRRTKLALAGALLVMAVMLILVSEGVLLPPPDASGR